MGKKELRWWRWAMFYLDTQRATWFADKEGRLRWILFHVKILEVRNPLKQRLP